MSGITPAIDPRIFATSNSLQMHSNVESWKAKTKCCLFQNTSGR